MGDVRYSFVVIVEEDVKADDYSYHVILVRLRKMAVNIFLSITTPL